ncbi:class I SAM-dependent methyltransferase [Thiorhodococcus fuscus]|uniref:Class I SAM-dependent methyltransferase n=1 Tax=Thiorhodococcus fuscus TaxID=527200 RepID=A0ABW4YDL0_9GAMM
MTQHDTRRQPPDEPNDTDTFAAEINARLQDRIRAAIAESAGLLPFDRFMELALYAPGLGYYVAGAEKFGPDGDFTTAPELSPLFGRCIANQCAEVLERIPEAEILEFGAGSGALAIQILGRLAESDALPKRYRILEPSPELRRRQRDRIQQRLPHLIDRCEWLDGLPERMQGIVIANEVLDAMPVHRFRLDDAGEPLEVCVGEREGAFTDVDAPIRSPGLAERIATLQAEGFAQTPGYASEINLRLAPWLSALSDVLERGLALLIDYGYSRSAYYQSDRSMGTLMCHYRHQAHEDPYRHIGLQDITAHVDFTAVAEAGLGAGFELAGFTTQAHFLIGCGIDQLLSESPDALEQTLAAKQLLLPTEMGERFKVMGLDKGMSESWRGFSVRDLSDRL